MEEGSGHAAPPPYPSRSTHSYPTGEKNPFSYGGPLPADVKPKNVILFGETGVGKSSVINLMAGAEVARISSDLDGCTMESTEYSFVLSGEKPFRIYDTVGLNEPEMGVNTFFGAVEKSHKLIKALNAAGGIDFLLFCIRGGRITTTLQRNYRLFFEILGEKKIPLAFVVTNLEHEDIMENWWERNEKTLRGYGIQSVAHACITAAPARVTMFATKREQSRIAMQQMFHEAFSNPNPPHEEEEKGWFARLIGFFYSLLVKNTWFKRNELSRKLESDCGFSRDDAERLAEALAKD